ncbi:hypothetical protein NKH77_28585 [Streptomyces sp. M19]
MIEVINQLQAVIEGDVTLFDDIEDNLRDTLDTLLKTQGDSWTRSAARAWSTPLRTWTTTSRTRPSPGAAMTMTTKMTTEA